MQKLPPPWRARRLASAYVVEDRNGTLVAFIYFRSSGVPRSAKALEREVARRVAVNFAKLPDLLGAPGSTRMSKVAFVPNGDNNTSVFPATCL